MRSSLVLTAWPVLLHFGLRILVALARPIILSSGDTGTLRLGTGAFAGGRGLLRTGWAPVPPHGATLKP